MNNSEVEFSILDPDNPHSLVNLCSDRLLEKIKNLNPNYFALTEEEFIEKYKPSALATKLKKAFYREWLMAVSDGKKISFSRVILGICTRHVFANNFLKAGNNPELAWIITPPQSEVMKMQDIIDRGIERMREIVELPIIEKVPVRVKGREVRDKEGNIKYTTTYNKAVMSEIRQVVQFLSDRLHGTSVQRHEIFEKRMSLNINANGSPKELAEKANVNDMSHEDIESQLADIDSKLLTDSTIDAEVTDDHHENSGTTQ